MVQSDTGDAISCSGDILGTFCDEIDIYSVVDANVSVGTPTIVRNKTADSPSKLSQNNHIQLVDVKGYFINENSRS